MAARLRRAVAPLLLWAALSLLYCLTLDRFIDDAYITFSYARTLATSGTWGMAPGVVSNAATSPLNVLVLAALVRIGIPATVGALVLTSVLIGLCLYCTIQLSRMFFGRDLWGYLACALLFANPLIASTTGLETQLFVALMLVVCLAWLRGASGWAGVAASLLVLTRSDGLLLVVLLVPLLLRRGLKPTVRFVTGFLPALIAWFSYSWTVLGSLVPDTLFIKRSQAPWGQHSFTTGPQLYFDNYPAATVLSVTPLVLALLAVFAVRANRKAMVFCYLVLGGALAHYVAYSLLGVPPYHWYYGWEAAAGALVAPLAAVATPGIGERLRRLVALPLVVLLAVGGAGWTARTLLVRDQMPIHSNWATVQQYRDIADWINANTSVQRFRIVGELGVIQYYTNAYAVNEFSDRSPILNQLSQFDPNSLSYRLLRWNFQNLRVEPLPVQAVLTTDCPAGGSYVKTWVTSSTWQPQATWCWRNS